MSKQAQRNIRLGIFVLVATILLIAALYFIGSKQNLFGSTIHIRATFHNVNGLMKGNNVRFAGIDIGTVESVEIFNDTSVMVVMLIKNKARPFIKKNAMASIGTDGLMGNKLVNINSVEGNSAVIEENDELQSVRPVEMDDMVRTLDVTNENMKAITSNLRHITDKINSRNSLWSLLMDTVVAENVKSSIVNIKKVSNESAMITGNIKVITDDIKKGKGSLGALLTDTMISSKVQQTIVRIESLSDTAAMITGDISRIVGRLENGEGSVGVLLNDTTFVHNLNLSMENIKDASKSFDENMEALKHSWPFKKYFRKQKKIKQQ